MADKSHLIDRFVHDLISPLTALHGAVGLLRRRLGSDHDPRINDLLQTMERSVDRLRHVCEQIIAGAVEHDGNISITVTTNPKEPAANQNLGVARAAAASSAATQGIRYDASGPLLLIAASTPSTNALTEALVRVGQVVICAEHTAEGMDIARDQHPAAIIIDPNLDNRSSAAIGILNADPDTKDRILLTLGPTTSSNDVIERRAIVALDRSRSAEMLARDILSVLAENQFKQVNTRHVLIVDDEPDIGTLLALELHDAGYTTTTAPLGADALRVVREQRFDLILLDLLLPDLDGFAVLGGLRAQPETQLTPIILISAINSPADKVRGLQLGADDYITKPFSGPELLARVEATMRRSEREGGANPSTRLPGNTAIERAIAHRIAGGAAFAVCYFDLDHFKAYNDSYGFLKGDTVIQRTAQILLDVVREQGNSDDFVGHIGGDDFVVISSPERVEAICSTIIARFDTMAPLFYDRTAREQGFISGVDRQGRPATFPLVSISIAVVSSEQRPFKHPGEVAQRSIEVKKQAKLRVGSVYLIDR